MSTLVDFEHANRVWARYNRISDALNAWHETMLQKMVADYKARIAELRDLPTLKWLEVSMHETNRTNARIEMVTRAVNVAMCRAFTAYQAVIKVAS